MALTDGAVLIPGRGSIWTGVVGTATKPTLAQLATFVSAGTVPATWTDMGHTDLDDILAFGQDGGDTTVKGSWQNASLREITTATAVDFFVVKSLQLLDNAIMALYWGGGDASTANEFALPDSPVPQEKAVTVVMVDGTTPLAFYVPKASIRRDDAFDMSDDDFAKAPLRFTLLKHSTDPRGIWVGDLLGA